MLDSTTPRPKPAEFIEAHFQQYLGGEVQVACDDVDDPQVVTVHAPREPLTELFVSWAYDALRLVAPDVAWQIQRLSISVGGATGSPPVDVFVADGTRR